MRRSGHISTSGLIFNPQFEIPIDCFLFDCTHFGGAYAKIYAMRVLSEKGARVKIRRNPQKS